MEISVTGDVPPRFTQTTTYRRTNYANAPVATTTSTAISNVHDISGGNVVGFEVLD